MEWPSACRPELCRISTLDGGYLSFSFRHLQAAFPALATGSGFEVSGERFRQIRHPLGMGRGIQPVTFHPLFQVRSVCPGCLYSLA